MPKAAIANGFFIGTVPEFFNCLSRTELAMLNLAIPQVYLTTVRGGKNSCIRSHAYSFSNEVGPVVALLPANITDNIYIKVSIIGAMTSEQQAKVAQLYEARPSKLLECAQWLINDSGNALYSNVNLHTLQTIDEMCVTVS